MNTSHQYLSGTLISDPIGSVSSKGVPGVKFTLSEETEHEEATALNFWCFVAELWPTILRCRRGDALSVVGRLRRQRGISQNETDAHGAEFTVRRVLSVRKRSIRASHEPELPEAA
jgi:hypothetical protein